MAKLSTLNGRPPPGARPGRHAVNVNLGALSWVVECDPRTTKRYWEAEKGEGVGAAPVLLRR